MKHIRNIISSLSLFILLIALVNIVLSLIVYYSANETVFLLWMTYRWLISALVIIIFIARGNIEINGHFYKMF